MTAAYDEAKRERWSESLDRVHAAGEKPIKPKDAPRPTPRKRTAVASEPTDLVASRRVRNRLGTAVIDLARARNLTRTAVRRMHNATPGYPTAATGGTATPTDEVQPDRWLTSDDAIRDLAAIERLAANIEVESRRLLNLAEKWGVTRIGTELSQSAHDRGCVSCNRANHYSPRREEGGEACEWCSKALRSINNVRGDAGLDAVDNVPLALVQKHARGQKVTANDIDRAAGIPPSATVHRTKK